MTLMRLTIRKQYWWLRWTNVMQRANVAECESSPKREIRIRRDLDDQLQLDCLLHEMLHAAFPDLKEEVVNETATDMQRTLWRLGYRRAP